MLELLRLPMVAVISCSAPPRLTVILTDWSGAISETRRLSLRTLVMFSPSMRRMTSSLRNPAFSAGTVLNHLRDANAAHLVHVIAAHVFAADVFGINTQKSTAVDEK